MAHRQKKMEKRGLGEMRTFTRGKRCSANPMYPGQIQAFQLVRESKGTKATPSGWSAGKPVLPPGPGLVGHVWKNWSVQNAS